MAQKRLAQGPDAGVPRRGLSQEARLGATKTGIFFVTAAMGTITLLVLLPFMHEIAKSFSMPTAVDAGKVFLWPVEPTLGNYLHFFKPEYKALLQGFLNNVLITTLGTLWSVSFTALTAFPISRPKREFIPGPALMGLFLFCIVFAPPMIPYFLTIRAYGLMDSWWALFLPHTVMAFNLILTVSYLRGLPEEMFEACRMDGGNDGHLAFRIAFPLAQPILATIAVYTAVMFWNIYLHPILFIRNPDLTPLQPVLRSFLAESVGVQRFESDAARDIFANTQSAASALVLLSIIPVALVYPLLQKYFLKGSLEGAIKS